MRESLISQGAVHHGASFDGLFQFSWNIRSQLLLVRGEISHGAKLTYARLAQKVDTKGRARSHVAKLAAHLGSDVQQIMLFLFELEKHHLIEIQSTLIGVSSLCCLLPDHPWMDHSESSRTNGSHSSSALKERSQSNGHSRGSGLNGQPNKFRREGAASSKAKSGDQQARQPLSKFTYEACLEHAIKKRDSGAPIRNVGGLANHFYWTGTEDEEIAKVLAADDTNSNSNH